MSAATRTELVENLRLDIVRHRYEPGSRLPIVELCDEFGVGLSDMHKAIGELAADRFVTSDTQRGVRAAIVSREDLEDLTQARLAIEGLALRSAIENASDESDAQIVGAFYNLSRAKVFEDAENLVFSESYRERHRIFHDALAGACSSLWLKRFRLVLFVHAERYQQLSVKYRKRSPAHRAEHKTIMEAVLERDADRAASLLKEHISSAAQLLLERHFGQQVAAKG